MTTPRPFHFAVKISPHGSTIILLPCVMAAVFMAPALSDREQVALVLDGPGAQQDFPVGAAGRIGEGRRHHDQIDRPRARYSSGKRRS
jgi:hypothetical protein